MNRKRFEMQWQVALTLLAQPVLSEEGAGEKQALVQELLDVLSGETLDDEEPDDGGTIALLKRAGREPIRKVDASEKCS